MFRHLLVPLDGSPMAEAVLPLAATWALRLRARITLLHVLDPTGPRLRDPEDAQTYWRASREWGSTALTSASTYMLRQTRR